MKNLIETTAEILNESWRNVHDHIKVNPIGVVNLHTGKNALFGSIEHGWAHDPSRRNAVIKHNSGGPSLHRVLHGIGSNVKIGDKLKIAHGQTHNPIGRDGHGEWTVHHIEPHTKEGLKNIAGYLGKKSAAFMGYD